MIATFKLRVRDPQVRQSNPPMSEIAAVRTVHAEVTMALGQVSLVREQWHDPYDHSGRTPEHHLQLSLLQFPENGRGCFPEAWGSSRFERIGQLFLLPAEQIVHVRSSCPEQKSIVYNFSAQALERWFDCGIGWTAPQLERSLAIVDPEIRRLMIRMGQELRNPGFAAEALIELIAAEITIALARQLRNVEAPSIKGGLSPWRLRLIDDYLEAHPAKASLTDLAEACQLSIRQLSRAFRLSRGCPIGTYIAQFRMEVARHRLASGAPVRNVAAELGFSSPSTFSAAFRRVTGEAPGRYGIGTLRS